MKYSAKLYVVGAVVAARVAGAATSPTYGTYTRTVRALVGPNHSAPKKVFMHSPFFFLLLLGAPTSSMVVGVEHFVSCHPDSSLLILIVFKSRIS
eukprot:COSAG06_NODE_28159_length_579_cov_1.337500_1_plen_95_part_00